MKCITSRLMSEILEIETEDLRNQIVVVHNQRVLLDFQLAKLYGVTTARLNEQVRRNRDKFPSDFIIALNNRYVTNLMSQFATSSLGHGGRRKPIGFKSEK